MCVFDGTYYKITTTNYIFKTSLYITFRMYSSGPWPLKILMFALLVTREKQHTADIDIKILGVPPPGPGMSFLDSHTCAEGGIYLFLPRFFSLHDAIHGWMTGRINGWMSHVMKKASRKRIMTSFTICNLPCTFDEWVPIFDFDLQGFFSFFKV